MSANDVQAKRRILVLLLLFSLLFMALLTRLFYLQLSPIFSTKVATDEQSIRQRRESFTVNMNRGAIVDRHGESLVGEQRYRVILFPSQLFTPSFQKGIHNLAQILNINRLSISQQLEKAKEPFILRDKFGEAILLNKSKVAAINQMAVTGIYAIPIEERYQESEVAQHIIGVIKQNPELIRTALPKMYSPGKVRLDEPVGIMGLERSFDRYLRSGSPATLSLFKDGRGEIDQGLGLRYYEPPNPFFPLTVKTTLDKQIQIELEHLFDRHQIKQGSGLLIDLKRGDLLAMVSRPSYQTNSIIPSQSSLINHSITQLSPGSVFKILVAAAALEERVVYPQEKFYCSGEYGKYGFSCWKKGGHGELTFGEAFQESCNIAFAEVANRLGTKTLQTYGERLGLTQSVIWQGKGPQGEKNFVQLPLEETGQIFLESPQVYDDGGLIQTAIGQKDVQITPLQAARLLMVVLNKGYLGEIRTVEELTYKNGATFARFPSHNREKHVLSSYTQRWLKLWMRKTVLEGTAKPLRDANLSIGGKTGTAEITKHLNNQWFVGYFPEDRPRYIIVVVAEREPSGGKNRVFSVVKEMVNYLGRD